MKRVTIGLALVLGLFAAGSTAQFADWSAPTNLGAPVNSEYNDVCVTISKNGLSLYFASNRQTGDPNSNNRDLYLSQRAGVGDPWGAPVPLAMLNTTGWESNPSLSPDEHRLYFVSQRPGGCGGRDIYVSRRQDRRDDFGWEAPVNLGCVADGYINGPLADIMPMVFEDETGTEVLYFTAYKMYPPWDRDIFESRMRADDTFGPGTPVPGLNVDSFTDEGATVRRDGLEVIFESNRPGGLGGIDLWMATRNSTAEPWSTPVNLFVLNSSSNEEGMISFSFDGRELYFPSARPGGLGFIDVYVARREKLLSPR